MLSDTQKTKVRKYLGYPLMYFSGYPLLTALLDGIDSISVEDEIQNCLTQLDALEAKIIDVRDRAGLIVLDKGAIEFQAGQILSDLMREAEIWVSGLEKILDYKRMASFGRSSFSSGLPVLVG